VGRAKLVVWAHNSHLGFTTFAGTVTAASDWDGPAERKRVRPALPGSYERLFHETGLPRFLLLPEGAVVEPLRRRRLERAIGVIYRPDTERASHYFEASLADQFDAVVHLDHTRAVEPLEATTEWRRGEVPETFPSAV
jgi:erythromycin esterase-like protein